MVPSHEEEGWRTPEIPRHQLRGGSGDESGPKTAYETPVLKRLGSVAEVTQGTHIGTTPDNAVLSV